MATYFLLVTLMLNDMMTLQAIPINAKQSTRATFISYEVSKTSDLITQSNEVSTEAIILETTQTKPVEIQQDLDIEDINIRSGIDEDTTLENDLSNEKNEGKPGKTEDYENLGITYRKEPQNLNNDTSDPTSRTLSLQHFSPIIKDIFSDDIKKVISPFNIFNPFKNKREISSFAKSENSRIGVNNSLASDAYNINVLLNDDKTNNNENLEHVSTEICNVRNASVKDEITDNAELSNSKLNKNENDVPEITIEDLNNGNIGSNNENKILCSLKENKNIIKRDVELQKIEIPILGNIKSISDGDNIKTFMEFLKDLINKVGFKIPQLNKEDGTIVYTKF